MSWFYDAEHMLSTISVCTKKILFTMWPQILGGGRQSRLETGVARQRSPSWAVRTADEALSLSNTVHIPNIFIFTIGHGYTAWTQEPEIFWAWRGFGSSDFISRFVDLKDKVEDRVGFYMLGVFWCIYSCWLGLYSHKQGAAGFKYVCYLSIPLLVMKNEYLAALSSSSLM